MSYRKLLFAILFLLAIDSYASVVTVSTHVHDMEFRDLARKWDEAIPLGNATIGSLIWQKGERLRMSIDRSDLWDLRHSKELEGDTALGAGFDDSFNINPVLILTSRDQVKDELQAFQLGADEYLTKPCRKDRLLARVSNILKRYEGRTNLIEGPDFLLDQQTYTLYIHNTSVVLPKNQGKLLVALLSGGDALVTTEQLCMALWGTTEYIDENALQVNLTRLKKTMSALEMKQRIVAVRGMS